jgi:hypothetical protein
MPEKTDPEKSPKQKPLPKFAVVMGVIGTLNALICVGVNYYLNKHWPADRAAGEVFENVWIWVWPVGLGMMAAPNTLYGVILFMGLAMTNGGIYFAVGLVIQSIWRRLVRHEQRGHDQ